MDIFINYIKWNQVYLFYLRSAGCSVVSTIVFLAAIPSTEYQ